MLVAVNQSVNLRIVHSPQGAHNRSAFDLFDSMLRAMTIETQTPNVGRSRADTNCVIRLTPSAGQWRIAPLTRRAVRPGRHQASRAARPSLP